MILVAELPMAEMVEEEQCLERDGGVGMDSLSSGICNNTADWDR